MSIRKIQEQDLSQMLKIWNQHSKFLTSTEKKHTKESLHRWYKTRKKGRHEYWGLFHDEELKGFTILKNLKASLWIKMLAVDNGTQGKGYGEKLVKFASKEANQKPIYTEIKVENIAALRFFLKNKFEFSEYDRKLQEYILKRSR